MRSESANLSYTASFCVTQQSLPGLAMMVGELSERLSRQEGVIREL